MSPASNSACNLSYRNLLPPSPPTSRIALGFFPFLLIVSFLCSSISLSMLLMTGLKIPLMSALFGCYQQKVTWKCPVNSDTYALNRITSPVSCLLPGPFRKSSFLTGRSMAFATGCGSRAAISVLSFWYWRFTLCSQTSINSSFSVLDSLCSLSFPTNPSMNFMKFSSRKMDPHSATELC
jgi:hypothetical protein